MKIGYSKTYPLPGSGCYEKIWLEDEIDNCDMESVRQVQYALKKQVENFHFESNKAAEKQAIQEQTVKEEPQSVKAKIIAQIYGCSTLKVLESFKLLSQNNKAVKAAYEQRFAELKGTS